MNPVPRRLHRAEDRAAVAVLADAFTADPLFVRLFGETNDIARFRQLRQFLTAVLAMNRWSGGLQWVVEKKDAETARPEGQLAGVAIVETPRVGWARGRAAAASVRFLPAALALPRDRVQVINRYGLAVRNAAPPAPHHYLSVIGVRPAHQGQGVASALLAAVIEASDSHPQSVGIALDTENEANIALYEHKGFTVTGTQLVAGLAVHSLFRPNAERRR